MAVINFGFAQDIVELKNGSTISGLIKEYVSGEYVKLISESGADITLSFDEVEHVKFSRHSRAMRTKGYFNNSIMGLMLGSDRWGNPQVNFSCQMINGHMFNEHFQLGLGIGLEGIDGTFYYPTFVDARWNFRKGTFTPFAGIQGGYTFHDLRKGSNSIPENPGNWWATNSEFDGGLMSGLNFGIKNMTRGNVGYTLSVGYRFQILDRYYRDWEFMRPVKETTYLNRIDFKFGITF